MGQHFCVPFSLRIQHIRDRESPADCPMSESDMCYWLPPSSRNQFDVISSTGWWIWDPGTINHNFRLRRPSAEELRHYQPHRTCSLFWCPDRQSYVLVPLDCTTTDIAANGYVWQRLTFGRSQTPSRNHIATVGYSLGEFNLHIRGPDYWFQQLLPTAYQTAREGQRHCALAGDLSILVGLLAFSVSPGDAMDAIRAVHQSFRPYLNSTRFRPNHLPESDSKSEDNFQQSPLVNATY